MGTATSQKYMSPILLWDNGWPTSDTILKGDGFRVTEKSGWRRRGLFSGSVSKKTGMCGFGLQKNTSMRAVAGP